MHGGRRSWTARVRARVARAWGSWWRSLGRLPMVRRARGRQLRRLHPLADGATRGTPIVRYYWERFLDRHRADLHGRCLEIGSTAALQRYGRHTEALALDLAPRPGVDVVADLSRADAVPADSFNAFVVPFTMHLIHDVDAALFHALRILEPGGVLLVNFPCVDYYFAGGLDMGTGAPLFVHWWFTPLHVENLLRRAGLGAADFTMTVDGNLFARVAYQMNLPAEEMTAAERDTRDPGHPLLVNARVVKPAGWCGQRPAYRDPWLPTATPTPWSDRYSHYPAP